MQDATTASAVAEAIYQGLREGGIRAAFGLPESVLGPVWGHLENDPDLPSYVCSREDEGVAMAIGSWLGGSPAVVVMEGSGVGLCGLVLARARVQRTPLLMLVSHSRVLGEPRDYHAATRLAGEGVVRGLDIPHHVLTDPARSGDFVRYAAVTMCAQSEVVAVFVPPFIMGQL